MAPILEIQGLYKTFSSGLLRRGPAVHALAGVDLTLLPGDTLGLVGESGCGKTTLARCALRLLEPDAGSILFDQIDLLRLPAAELRTLRRQFQIVFQNPFTSLDPRMTVAEILSEPFEVHRLGTKKTRREQVLRLLAEVAVDAGLIARFPWELSGGQQQRIAIARALALQPRFLIADEPVSALDASVQAQILSLMVELRKSHGLTLLMITHSLPVVHYLCARVAVMYLGRIVEEAPVQDFFSAPRHPYSQALLASMPALGSSDTQPKPVLSGEPPFAGAPPPGCAFHPRCPKVFCRCREELPVLQTVQNTRVACFLFR